MESTSGSFRASRGSLLEDLVLDIRDASGLVTGFFVPITTAIHCYTGSTFLEGLGSSAYSISSLAFVGFSAGVSLACVDFYRNSRK